MRRNHLFLLFLAVVLAGLIVGDKLRSHAVEAVTSRDSTPGALLAGSHPPSDSQAADASRRQRVRARLRQAGGETYLDSLLISADSLLRRWDNRHESALRVGVVEGGVGNYHPRMLTLVREAARRWETAVPVVRFAVTRDTTGADIVVHWRGAFDQGTRAGQTDLTWDHQGRLIHADVLLATRAPDGTALDDDALLAIALHELGHALGLPHSARSDDVMFPTTRATDVSPRDRATIRLLYDLPPGPVREP